MKKYNKIKNVVEYIPTDHRGLSRKCDSCECHLALEKVAYQLETDNGYIQLCERCHQKV